VFALGSLTLLVKGVFLLRKSSEGLGLSEQELAKLSDPAVRKTFLPKPLKLFRISAQVPYSFGHFSSSVKISTIPAVPRHVFESSRRGNHFLARLGYPPTHIISNRARPAFAPFHFDDYAVSQYLTRKVRPQLVSVTKDMALGSPLPFFIGFNFLASTHKKPLAWQKFSCTSGQL
jgi:hypothetical protein